MPTYKEYQDQIAKLQSLADAARREEIGAAQQEVAALMKKFGLTPNDFKEKSKKLEGGTKPGRVAPKYKDPESGKTWTGRGRAPRWLDGKKKSDFAIT